MYLLEERHDDGLPWVGTPELVIRHDRHTQQMEGETALTIRETSHFASHLSPAARFATRLAQQISADAAQGIVDTDAPRAA